MADLSNEDLLQNFLRESPRNVHYSYLLEVVRGESSSENYQALYQTLSSEFGLSLKSDLELSLHLGDGIFTYQEFSRGREDENRRAQERLLQRIDLIHTRVSQKISSFGATIKGEFLMSLRVDGSDLLKFTYLSSGLYTVVRTNLDEFFTP